MFNRPLFVYAFALLAPSMTLAETETCQKVADKDIAALFEAVMRETEAVGRAEGVRLPGDVVEDRMKAVRAQAAGVMASMCHDLLRGGRLELPWLAGKVVELGRRHGIPTPARDRCQPRRLRRAFSERV